MGWSLENEDGATLADYGVDEDAEAGMEMEDEEAQVEEKASICKKQI